MIIIYKSSNLGKFFHQILQNNAIVSTHFLYKILYIVIKNGETTQ